MDVADNGGNRRSNSGGKNWAAAERESGSAAEKRKSVRPSFQHILSAQIFTGSHFPSLGSLRIQKYEPDRCADLGHRWSEKRGRDDPILEALYLREG